MINVVLGPPCGGKSTHVQANAAPGDVQIDFDKLAQALGASVSHDTTGAIRAVAFAARKAAIAKTLDGVDANAWIIHTKPSDDQMAAYAGAGAQFTTCDPGLDECVARAKKDNRPAKNIQAITDWYAGTNTKGLKAMQVEHKDATITPTGADTDFPGTFEVILSAPTLDRDGEILGSSEWKTPLPDHITFDTEHGMSVGTTVGSGVPSFNDSGQLVVSGTYSSLPRAQEVRTLVKEGHIRTTSVAFLTLQRASKGVKAVRELINGAFVAVPSNREALILSSKSGARNSASDAKGIQAIHDQSAALGADCSMGKSYGRKDAGMEDDTDPVTLISAVDAAIDEALVLLANTDLTTLPAEVQQAIALIQAADVASDELLETLGIPDPDEDADSAAEVDSAAAAKAAAAVETKAAVDADSDAVTDEEIEAKALAIFGAQFI